jgi:hypothetical protein
MLKGAKERLGLCELREESPTPSFVGVKSKEGPPANEAKEAKEWHSSYAHPWPDALPALGSRDVGPYTACADCGTGTWVRFGDYPLCLGCAAVHA